MKYKIFLNNEHINTIVADENFVVTYCETNGYTYELMPEPNPNPAPEPAPTDTEVLNALLGMEVAL